MALTFPPFHSEGVGGKKGKKAHLTWLFLFHWVSVFFQQADYQFVNSTSLVNPDTIEGTFPEPKQDI